MQEKKIFRRRSYTLRCSLVVNGTVGGRTSGETLIGAEGARHFCSISQAKGQKVTIILKEAFLVSSILSPISEVI